MTAKMLTLRRVTHKTDYMETLRMTESEWLDQYLSNDGQPYDKVVVGAIIGKIFGLEGLPNILLLQRTANVEYKPNTYEIPYGDVKGNDSTIYEALLRVIKEKTGMKLVGVKVPISPVEYTSDKKTMRADGKELIVKGKTIQLNFICDVAISDVQVERRQHSHGIFVHSREAHLFYMTEQMHGILEEAYWDIVGK